MFGEAGKPIFFWGKSMKIMYNELEQDLTLIESIETPALII